MYAEERQQAMAREITQHGRVSVTSLAKTFRVTTETVRRDLSNLDRMGLVRRVHGGAVPAQALSVIESGVGERDLANTAAKDAIAAAAVAHLPEPGSIIVVDAGSTTARFAAAMQDQRLTVVTHAVPVASRLAGAAQIELHLLPGRVRHTTHAAVGIDTVEALSHLRVDVAFVATNGLTVEHGLTTPDHDEAATKRAIIGAAKRTIVLADASKIGIETAVRFGDLDDIDVLITDSSLEAGPRRALEKAGIEVVAA